ncbi:MAG: sulfatase-like hydrolase/transferase [Hormoscilla sp. GM102CHS1]|nr:sulfatase-like hydrolase/transferase [Hormoscilla sp. GM102CHS1]
MESICGSGDRPVPSYRQFAEKGFKLLNLAPESQCTPSRSAIMTGRYAMRSGTHTVALPGLGGGIVAWEKTMGDVLKDAGYDNYIVGKWHIGESKGRLPMDHGFLHGVPRTYDEALFFEDPFYNPEDPERGDPVSHVVVSDLGGDLQGDRSYHRYVHHLNPLGRCRNPPRSDD